MSRVAIRFLGIGIFIAGAVFTIYSTFLPAPANSETDLELAYHASQEELQVVKQQLADLQLNLNQSKENNQTVIPESTNIRTTILTIEPGMTPSEVSTILENTQIIDNRDDLEKYLVENGLSSKLQVGKYEISSDMSIQKIVEIITKKQ